MTEQSDSSIERETFNPFQPPAFVDEDAGEPESPAATIRRNYQFHEAAVRSIGLLCLIGCIGFCVTGALATVFALVDDGPLHRELPLMAAGFLIVGGALLPLAVAMMKLQLWARNPICILACLALIAFPIGTLIGGYIVYATTTGSLDMVLSHEYRAVIDQTPSIKARLSGLVWIVFGLVVTGTVAAISLG